LPAARRSPLSGIRFVYDGRTGDLLLAKTPLLAPTCLNKGSGDPEIQAVHAQVAAASRQALLPLLASEPAAARAAGSDDTLAMDLVWEVLRSVLQAWRCGGATIPKFLARR
jgi:hypothetical protein